MCDCSSSDNTGVTMSDDDDDDTPERRVECRDARAGCHQCRNPVISPAAAAADAADRRSLCPPPLSMSLPHLCIYNTTNHSTQLNLSRVRVGSIQHRFIF